MVTITNLQAQSLHIVAQTPQYTDYVISNDSLHAGSPISILIPYAQGSNSFRILKQEIVPVTNDSLNNSASQKKQETAPLYKVVSKGMYRKHLVASLRIQISRPSNNNTLLITKYLKIRVLKTPPVRAKIESTNELETEFGVNATQDSPLATGTWYKIPIQKDGIYKITKTYLSNLGINVSNIDPRDIQIWGTNGYPLPEPNSVPRPQFKQIPIIVSGESDGVFNNNDYILFYGNSPNRVIYNSSNETYSHEVHPYSNYNYVFLTIGKQKGERLKPDNAGQSASQTLTTFRDFLWKEQELTKSESDMKSGTQWLGQTFTNESYARTQTIYQDTIPGIVQNQSAYFQVRFAARSTNYTTFYLSTNNSTIGQVSVNPISDLNGLTGYSAHENTLSATVTNFTANNNIIKVLATFGNPSSSSKGWLDWIQLNFTRKLTPKNGRLLFYSPRNGQTGSYANYVLTGFKSKPVVMNVTNPVDPKLLSVTDNNGNYDCVASSEGGQQLIAQTNFYTPEKGEAIANQNLHGITTYPNYIIVTAKKFLTQAKELAQFHQNNGGLRPLVVTQEQIFNGFSGGVPDPVAIRDFMRFLYLRAGNDTQRLPDYLLLFGNTTYDYKGIIKNAPETNYVFTYESKESLQRINSYASDDYFGLLDNNEGDWTENSTQLVDIGIGRIPAQTVQDAQTAVNKIESYSSNKNDGDWKTLFTFAADDDYPEPNQNRDLHTMNADSTAAIVENSDEGLHVKKIYEFSYPVVNTTAGRRYPQATQDFLNTINNGSLVVDYSGHGAEEILSGEHLFVSNEVNQFTNKNRLSIFVTATCDFGRFDDTQEQCGAEKTIFWPDGGMAAAFSTDRVVYTSADPNSLNFGLNRILIRYMSTRNSNGEPRRLGDIYRLTKVTGLAGPSFNSRKFILLGDPAMRIGLPKRTMKITKINNVPTSKDSTIQIRALDHVNIQGEVMNGDSTLNTGFTGQVNVKVYDASRYVKLPERSWMKTYGCYLKGCHYKVQNDILFNGRESVKDGHFTANFIVPKDISYSNRKGKILLYAQDPTTDAAGEYSNFTLGGTNPNAQNDKKGPKMNVYLNDPSFMDGSVVSSSPKLIVKLSDPYGINTTGTGVGHQLIAKLNSPDKPEKTIVLNDFYTSNLNDFTSGTIDYPLQNLSNGDYTLTVRAWDVYNNASTQQISFKVAKSNKLTIPRVYNFPNPMNNDTRFIIEHNQPGNPMNINIRIYTLSGRPVAHLEKDDVVTSSPYVSIEWFGRDDDGDRLATGTYLYVVRVQADTPKGEQSVQKIEKLVIIH